MARACFRCRTAAQLASLLVGPLPERCRILDGCAGLGGKTSHLVEMLPPGGTVVAVELIGRRYRLLKENLLRLGQREAVIAVRADLRDYAASHPPPFDAILIDAPCSGTGVIRRQPDIRWNRQPEICPPTSRRNCIYWRSPPPCSNRAGY